MSPHAKNHDCCDSCCLRVEDLSVTIGRERILTDVNLHIHCGQMAALIGPNGAGKSTMIRTILGQLPYTGKITFSRPGEPGAKLRIGYVPQTPSFDIGDPISVADLFACCNSKRPAFLGVSKAMRKSILQSLDRVNAQDLIDRRVGALSGGELQRVLLALALEPVPNLLILDEPLSGVDVEGMSSLMDMIDSLRRTYDLSILMTTHDFSLLEKYMDKVILLDGRVLSAGAPQEVLASDAFRTVFHLKGGSQQ